MWRQRWNWSGRGAVLAGQGAEVTVLARRADRLEALCPELLAAGAAAAHGLVADLDELPTLLGQNLAGDVGPIGAYPVLSVTSIPEDLDEDGMCDDWENKHGLDPTNPQDFNDDRNGDGYTNLEEYLQRLVDDTLGAGATCVGQ